MAAAAAVLRRAVTHGRHGLARQHELADRHADAIHTGQDKIVALSGVDDQELSIGPIGTGEYDRTVDRRGDGRAGRRADRHPLLDAAESVGIAESLEDRAGDGDDQRAPGVGEGDRRLQPRRVGVAQGRRLGGDVGGVRPVGRAGRFHLGDQIFEICRLVGELGGAVALGGERLLGLGQRLLARLDQSGEPHLVGGQRRRALREVVALLGDRGAQIGELGEVGAQGVRLALQRFDHRAEQGGGANRLGHILRPDQDRRRRVAAHALQHRQHVGDDGAAVVERAGERVGVGVEAVEALVGGGDLPFGVLHLGGGVDQRRVEPGPVGAQRFDVGLDLAALLVGGADRVLDPAQTLLRRGLVVGRAAAGGGRRRGRRGGGADWARAGKSAERQRAERHRRRDHDRSGLVEHRRLS